ncbi:hypothetical protein WJX77_004849 [Trebouxia sp. C0004]
MKCVSKCNECASGGPNDERLTDHLGEDSTEAGLQSKVVVPGNVVVESDGPDSDQPETKASMASMIEQSMEGWRLIGQGMQSLFTCSCFTGLQPSRNTLNQLRGAV